MSAEIAIAVLVLIVAIGAAGWAWTRRALPGPTEAPDEAPPAARPPAPLEATIEVEAVQVSAKQLPARRPAPRDRRDLGWIAALATAAPIAALGLYVHHRRFVGYHRLKGTEPPLSFGRWVRGELRGAGVLGWWHVRGLLPGAVVVSPCSHRMVLCVHGYSQTGTNFVGLRRVLQAAGHPTTAITLGHWLAPISWYAGRLARHLERTSEAHPEGFDVVAHSMGGVLLRVVLRERPQLGEKIRTVVTLGSPHRGTAAARGIPLLPEVRALRRSSPLLRDLPQLPALLPRARVVTVAGTDDTVVYPVDTALVDGADKVVLKGVGHAGLLTHPKAWATVRRALSSGACEAP